MTAILIADVQMFELRLIKTLCDSLVFERGLGRDLDATSFHTQIAIELNNQLNWLNLLNGAFQGARLLRIFFSCRLLGCPRVELGHLHLIEGNLGAHLSNVVLVGRVDQALDHDVATAVNRLEVVTLHGRVV
eukprot:CAMPEP_0185588248 /NCGR_PEP_ID=MMETSP0434-20130131/52277_1 /TAXON_ID=626734 ORGANISM="Favella taraikaensis, Strain Fe Narragansett Bay" /NCGR_SAMPLE_ID=MMETSP0434 /ASSEMBLY_ACC=CAM_ASM_000379 /LENGTH=131 /DNA_ID=CAMNT_0028210755 /DNA_START=1804 /DNA_END=2199 /DNA_ORIENTATION=+